MCTDQETSQVNFVQTFGGNPGNNGAVARRKLVNWKWERCMNPIGADGTLLKCHRYYVESKCIRQVARGFEAEGGIQKHLPTTGKCAMIAILAITASKWWIIKITDIKSAFVFGK